MTKVTLVTSAKPLNERCKKCKRPNGTTFRTCQRCLEKARKRHRKKYDATPVCPPGQRLDGRSDRQLKGEEIDWKGMDEVE